MINLTITVNGNDVKGDWDFGGSQIKWSWFQRALKPKGKKAPVWRNAGIPIWQESWSPDYVTSQIDLDVPAGTYIYRVYAQTVNGDQLESNKVTVTI